MKKRKKKSNLLKRQMLLITGLAMLAISLLLSIRFYLMLYFPGTQATAALFKIFLPIWTVMGYLSFTLKSPLTFMTNFLQSHFPALAPKWFPIMHAADLMAGLTHQPLALCKTLYPGNVDWLCILAIPFWNFLLLTLHQGYWYLKDSDGLHEVAHESMAILSEYKAAHHPKAAPPTPPPVPQPRQTPSSNTQPESGAPRYTDARTSERLAQSKSRPANMPQAILRPGTPEWDQYKKEQGDMMVRDMVRQLRQENSSLKAQQHKLRSTFSQYFSPQALQYLENNKGSFQKVDNEKHLISVLFCDIRGFSSYSLSASSDDVVAYLGEYFEIASHYILQKHNGIVSKLMGDGLMAYWGFPAPNEDHAYTATRAAMDILHEVALRNQTKPNAVPLNIGIGIATGEAIVGNIGSEDFKDFTLIGPSVNMAARLEEANKTLGTSLLISNATHAALQGRIACKDCGDIEIRGWQNKEHVYAPVIKKID